MHDCLLPTLWQQARIPMGPTESVQRQYGNIGVVAFLCPWPIDGWVVFFGGGGPGLLGVFYQGQHGVECRHASACVLRRAVPRASHATAYL